MELDELAEQMDAVRDELAEHAGSWGLTHLAAACESSSDRREILEAAAVDLVAMGLTVEQGSAAIRAGEVVALLMVAIQQVAALALGPDIPDEC